MEKKSDARIFDKPFSHKKAVQKSYFTLSSDIMVARYDNQDTIIAVGSADGMVRLYNINTLNLLLEFNTNIGNDKIPCTTLKWRPTDSDGGSGSSSIMASNASGNVVEFSTKTGKKLFQKQQEDNYINAIDFSSNGKSFAMTGKDCRIRLYDAETKEIQSTLAGIAWHKAGHNNRLFGLKFSLDNPNLLISGGWDQNVHIWDVRESKVVGTICGPKICGDSIDIKDKYILTGAHRIHEQVQVWELGTQKLVHSFTWENPESSGLIFAAQFSKTNSSSLAAVGGNAMKMFDYKDANYPQLMQVRVTDNLYCLDLGNSCQRILLGAKGGGINCLNITTI